MDTLIIPEPLGVRAEVESRDPELSPAVCARARAVAGIAVNAAGTGAWRRRLQP